MPERVELCTKNQKKPADEAGFSVDDRCRAKVPDGT